MLGRNDLCHCGSGKKYKKCCMAKDLEQKRYEKTQGAADSLREKAQDRYIEMHSAISEYAADDVFRADVRKAQELFFVINKKAMHEKFEQLFLTYFIFDYVKENKNVVALDFINDNNPDNQTKNDIVNILNSYMTLLTIREMRSRDVILADEFTGIRYTVNELSTLKNFKVGDSFMGRLATIEGTTILLDLTVNVPHETKEFIKNDILNLYNLYKSGYENILVFLISNSYLFYRYVQQLLDKEVADFMIYQNTLAATETIRVSDSDDEEKDKSTASESGAVDVADLLKEKADAQVLELSLKLFDALKSSDAKLLAQPQTIASVIEYHALKESKLSATQKEIAKKYGISPSTLSKNYNELKEYFIEG